MTSSIFPMGLFPAAPLPLRRQFIPQKVKNIVTSIPMAAAPVAMMKASIVLSISPLNTSRVAFSGASDMTLSFLDDGDDDRALSGERLQGRLHLGAPGLDVRLEGRV